MIVLTMPRRSKFRPCNVHMSRRDIVLDARQLPLFAWAGVYRGALRADGRMNDTGRIRPLRPCPKDFRETYILIGWDGIMEHYRANWRCIARWIDECGRKELKRDRAEHLKRNGRARLHVEPSDGGKSDRTRRARRYVMGMTLTEKTR